MCKHEFKKILCLIFLTFKIALKLTLVVCVESTSKIYKNLASSKKKCVDF